MTEAADAPRLLALPDAAERTHRSIGEVLALLKDEYDDVTISKIRFLESQGLIEPERTPSGYRRFYDRDLLRLRWVLRQQRDHFLPLRVIKERLAELGDDELTRDLASASPVTRPVVLPEPSLFERSFTSDPALATPPPAPSPEPPAAPTTVAAPQPPRPAARSAKRRRGSAGPTTTPVSAPVLAESLGVPAAFVHELVRFGLVTPRVLAGEQLFDADAAAIVRLAAALHAHGLDARHLRMYKMSVEREVGVIQQLVAPLLRDHDETRRRRATAELHELLDLGEQLRAALIDHETRELR